MSILDNIFPYHKRCLISIYKTEELFKRILVQLGSSLPSQRHYAHLMLSHEHRLYLIHIVFTNTT
nr:MAG TPA: hypothetical protein [Caudoviricetes sp.]